MNRTDLLAAYYRERAGQWISAYDLERVAGRFAWRTRSSECARKYRMQIEARTITHANGSKEPQRMFVPPRPLGQGDLWEGAA